MMPSSDREQERHEGQLDRDRHPLDEHLGDRVGPKRIEVPRSPVAEVGEVDPELDRDRLVEAVADAEVGARCRVAPLPERDDARVAGEEPRQREDERRRSRTARGC